MKTICDENEENSGEELAASNVEKARRAASSGEGLTGVIDSGVLHVKKQVCLPKGEEAAKRLHKLQLENEIIHQGLASVPLEAVLKIGSEPVVLISENGITCGRPR